MKQTRMARHRTIELLISSILSSNNICCSIDSTREPLIELCNTVMGIVDDLQTSTQIANIAFWYTHAGLDITLKAIGDSFDQPTTILFL